MQAGLQRRDQSGADNTAVTGRLHAERARGAVRLGVCNTGLKSHREEGSLKIRLPSGSGQAILINTSGGIAGGDRYEIHTEASGESRLSIASQAAERVYRTLGPPAEIAVSHQVRGRARLCWLPQETILFADSSLVRRLHVELDDESYFLGMESTVLGRRESGEVLRHIQFREDWTVRRAGRLLHSERLRINGSLPSGRAELQDAGAFATLLLAAPDAEAHAARCYPFLGPTGGLSAWEGRLVIRLLEEDGFRLRKRLLALVAALLPPAEIPRVWLI